VFNEEQKCDYLKQRLQLDILRIFQKKEFENQNNILKARKEGGHQPVLVTSGNTS
jgi:hypothetical protein